MKIEKTINKDIDVEVDVSIDDLMIALYEDHDTYKHIEKTISNIYGFFRRLTDEDIKQLPDANRKLVVEKFAEQIKRFSA